MYQNAVSPETAVYLWKPVGWKALRPVIGLFVWAPTSPLSSGPMEGPWCFYEKKVGGSSHIHTHASRSCADRHGHRSRPLSDCTGVCPGKLSGSRTFNRSSLPIPSYLEEGITWPYTGSLTQHPFKCACTEKEGNEANAGSFMCVTEAFSKDSLNPNARPLNFQLLIS